MRLQYNNTSLQTMNTTQCPFHHTHALRKDLPPLTRRLAKLPVDERGYPVPFFVAWIDGKPEFRLADGQKFRDCLRFNLCWVCGESLGTRKSFVIGPMCTVNRIAADPATHPDCADWSVRGCPFLTKPKMVRREDELTESQKHNVAGIMIERNPGVMAIWTTKSFKVVRDPVGKPLLSLGDPESVTWWREGRPATRAEVVEGMATGLPTLLSMCQNDEDRGEVYKMRDAAMKFAPVEVRG